MLSLREHLHDDLVMVAVLGPVVHGVIDALPAAAAQHLASEAGLPLRRRRSPSGGWTRAAAGSNELTLDVTFYEAGLSAALLARRTCGRQAGCLPMTIAISGDLVAFSFTHDLFDGVSAWAHITPIVERALGLVPIDTKETMRHPVFATLRQAKLLSLQALKKARGRRRLDESRTAQPAQLTRMLEIDDERRAVGWTTVTLDAQQLALIDATVSREHLASEHASRRSLRSMKLAETVLSGLQRATDPEHDFRIRLPIDLRRYAPRGWWVDGPFSASYPIGTLRSGDNSAPALTARVASIVSSKAPLAALLGDLSGLIKNHIRHPFKRTHLNHGRDTFDLTISMLPSRLPEGFWASPNSRVNGVLQFHPIQPTAPYVQVADAHDMVLISLWDEGGLVDPAKFTVGILTALSERILPSKGSSKRV